jgi:uncharacterized ion transporter superfamily protein YfcC
VGELLAGVPAGWVTSGGAAGIVVIAVIAVLRGWLIPATTFDKMVKQYEDRIAELIKQYDVRVTEAVNREKEWREAHKVAEEARRVAASQVDDLLQQGETVEAFIRALPIPGNRRGR